MRSSTSKRSSDRKSTRLNSSHQIISYAVFCLKKKNTSVNAANQVVSVGADIAFDADPKFFACLVRFESSSVPTTLPTAYDVYPLDGRHDGGYYTVKYCVTIDVLPRTPVFFFNVTSTTEIYTLSLHDALPI